MRCSRWSQPAIMLPGFRRGVYSVSLTRTTGGVANVSGENFADVGFGIGYAQAQDGICLLAETFLTVDGERSAFLGPEGTFKNEAEGGLVFTNLNSDVYWTSIKDDHTIQKLLKLPYPQGPSTEGLEAVRGYAAGYDAYLRHIGGASGVTNPACKGAAWVRPIKADRRLAPHLPGRRPRGQLCPRAVRRGESGIRSARGAVASKSAKTAERADGLDSRTSRSGTSRRSGTAS